MEKNTSLDRMHDIVVPEAHFWWPWAPGWYIVLSVLVLVACYLGLCWWKSWRANAYRREALQMLEKARTIDEISNILRRTALAFAPRRTVANQVGPAWPQWLESTSPVVMSDQAKSLLIQGIYKKDASNDSLEALREFAGQWIKQHRWVPKSS